MLNRRPPLSNLPADPRLGDKIGALPPHTHREPVQPDVFSLFLDLLYPKYCCNCRRLGQYLCATCYELLHFYSFPITLKLDPLYLDTVTALGSYSTPLSSLIHVLKYQSVKGVARLCAELLYQHTSIPEVEAIVPVPIAHQRQRERGFNQATEIGEHLSELTGIPLLDFLQRTKHTPPQASITDQAQRKIRLQNHFSVREGWADRMPGKILLLDDVVTSGATLNECGKVLKEIGVTQIHGLTLAHGM